LHADLPMAPPAQSVPVTNTATQQYIDKLNQQIAIDQANLALQINGPQVVVPPRKDFNQNDGNPFQSNLDYRLIPCTVTMNFLDGVIFSDSCGAGRYCSIAPLLNVNDEDAAYVTASGYCLPKK
jgi:hypothetical protein